jgi:NTE family protein
LLLAGGPLPFPVTWGTSAGAINAAVLAADADDFARSAERLLAVWENFYVSQVYRSDAFGALANSARWLAAALPGGRLDGPVSLLDNSPLARLLARHMDFAAAGRHIGSGCLQAFVVTCFGYNSGRSVTFYQGHKGLAGWERARRIWVAMPLPREQLLASSALLFIFLPVLIHGQYYGDGPMRQIAPVSPALHLGDDRLLVIGVGRQSSQAEVPQPSNGFPPLAQIAGHELIALGHAGTMAQADDQRAFLAGTR